MPASETAVSEVAEIIQLAVAPVFLLAGIGAFLNVCASRLARIVDRARQLEPQLLGCAAPSTTGCKVRSASSTDASL